MYRSILVVVLVVFMFSQSSPAWSDEANDMRITDSRACEMKKRIMSRAAKRAAVVKCKCIVDNTDYSVVIAGNEAEIKEEKEKATLACELKDTL